jgi:hypothetical protein
MSGATALLACEPTSNRSRPAVRGQRLANERERRYHVQASGS